MRSRKYICFQERFEQTDKFEDSPKTSLIYAKVTSNTVDHETAKVYLYCQVLNVRSVKSAEVCTVLSDENVGLCQSMFSANYVTTLQFLRI